MADFLTREQRLYEWFAPARLGMFYHWGLFTGGGCSSTGPEGNIPLTYDTIAAFEQAAADPEAIAANMVKLAKDAGAKYVTCTALHSCERFAVLYPTKLQGFVLRTTKDYVGAFINCSRAEGLVPLLYMPAHAQHSDGAGGPWIADGYREPAEFVGLLKRLIKELYDLHGEQIGGFWLDGNHPQSVELPDYVHSLLPHAIFIINNETTVYTPGMDYCTTEFLCNEPDPVYCRPSGLRKVQPTYGVLPPKKDFNEDIPTCNGWWYGAPGSSLAEIAAGPYAQDPTYLVREMISSLGQRGQWNFSLGIGPLIDGSSPEIFRPMLANMGQFMAWAGAAIYDTTGGEGAPLQLGWTNDGGFFSLTVSLQNPDLLYVLVTTAPSTALLCIQNTGNREVAEITDLRSGQRLPFTNRNRGCIELPDMDWADVARYGAKVLQVTLA
ncbi:MAG TPA: alpha-L-fucosidase [Armatimonadota bacterium]|jgi:hypothetical protein